MTEADFIKEINTAVAMAEKVILDACVLLGERSVALAKERGRYINRTGALRSSIGYAVAIDGNIYKTGGFSTILKGGEGANAGRALAERVARESKGITMCLVAGAKYAVYVNAKGFDVIDSAEIFAQTNAPLMIKQLGLVIA